MPGKIAADKESPDILEKKWVIVGWYRNAFSVNADFYQTFMP
jgi:hypothetical protein